MTSRERNTGVYICEKCKLHIKVLSKSRHQGMSYPKFISNCPQCGNEVKMIESDLFNNAENDLWIRVRKNQIKYSLKFPVKKNLLQKASPKEV